MSSYFPPPQHIYQPQQQSQIPPQYAPGMYPPQMTPSIPPNPDFQAIPPQRFQQPPYQIPNIPQINPAPTPIPINAPAGVQYQPVQNPQPSKLNQQFKKAPPQPQQFSIIASNLNQSNKERYVWTQKKEKMKWGLAESIDVDQIARTGDINSVLFYLNQFMNANITKDDIKQFGTKGSLNAFLILQLGVEYLLNGYNKIKQEFEQNYYPAEEFMELANKLNSQTEDYNQALLEREKQIQILKDQKKELERRVNELKTAIQTKLEKRKKKHNTDQTSTLETHKHHHHSKPKNETSEPGEMHNSTAYQQFKDNQHSNKAKNSKKHNNDDDSIHFGNTNSEYSSGEIHGQVAEDVVSFLTQNDGYDNDTVNDSSKEEGEIVQYEEEEDEGDDY